MRTVVFIACLLFSALFFLPARCRADSDQDDLFNKKIRPILASHCLKCHGPDEKTRKGKLRLDLKVDALRPGKSGARAIVPGKVEDSEVVTRIFSNDENEVMPPPSNKNALTKEQKELIKNWIAGGAEYRDHWAFIPPRQTNLPAVRQREWPRNPIDRFILARLESEGLAPSPEADKTTILRRVSLDLTGLPPTPEEAKHFLEDRSPDAYEKLVDRLLKSPHYGERWARRWLDLARYADTNGYEKDRTRSIWPYRDWVINALNNDMPFQQFTLEQIAGDMLPNATTSQRVATGLHRNTMLNEEGGIDPLEFRFYAMNDRVTTTGTTWLGLTLLCAQCHTHKYDPIPQRDYYQFMALLDNADEPEIALPSTEIEQQKAAIEKKIEAAIALLPDKFLPEKIDPKAAPAKPVSDEASRKSNLDRKYADWLQGETREANRWQPLKPAKLSANLPRLVDEGDGVVLAVGDQSKRDVYTLDYQDAQQKNVTAIRLEVLPDPRLPRNGPGRVYYEGANGDFFLSEFRLTSGGKPIKIKSAVQSFAGDGVAAAIDGDPQTGWGINGGQGRAHSAVFILEKPIADLAALNVEMVFERYHAAGLGKFRLHATSTPPPIIAREHMPLVESALRVAEKNRSQAQKELLLREFLLTAPELAEARKPIDALRNSIPSGTTSLVMQERPSWNPRQTYVRHRGEYLSPTDKVEPAVLTILPPLPKDAPRNRLELGKWLASPENPLSGRVTVNRQWAAIFGTGLVRTTEDFGYQGEAPSHPELLDWLAVEFMKTGSMKSLHKLIVMSSTYRQDSRTTPQLLARDPKNRLLARGPRVRLDAEAIRDQALRASGLLSTKVGGPSVFPPQSPGVTTEGSYGQLSWKVSEGEDRYRRGLYTFSKRTTPFAVFNTFDAPSGEFCISRREVSNTPLQALMLLNDPGFEEAAQALGKRYAAAPGTVDERIDDLFRRCLVRSPDKEERAWLASYLKTQTERFKKHELDPTKVAGAGPGDPAERAGWTVLARAILNLDETVTKG